MGGKSFATSSLPVGSRLRELLALVLGGECIWTNTTCLYPWEAMMTDQEKIYPLLNTSCAYPFVRFLRR